MNGKEHTKLFFISLIALVPLYGYLDKWQYIPLLILSQFVVNPDIDQYVKWLPHRNWCTHSVFLPALITVAIWLPFAGVDISFMEIFSVLSLPTMIHLAADIPSKNPQGSYRISMIKRLSVGWSRAWLVGNIALGIGLMFL